MKKNILIIEDDVNIAHGLSAQFSVLGYDTVINDGNMPLKNIVHQVIIEKPDYIVLDLVLPNISGFELLNNIKANEDAFLVPVFVFSDMSDEDVKMRCHNLGADYYFLKEELNVEQFTKKVNRIIINREKIN